MAWGGLRSLEAAVTGVTAGSLEDGWAGSNRLSISNSTSIFQVYILNS